MTRNEDKWYENEDGNPSGSPLGAILAILAMFVAPMALALISM